MTKENKNKSYFSACHKDVNRRNRIKFNIIQTWHHKREGIGKKRNMEAGEELLYSCCLVHFIRQRKDFEGKQNVKSFNENLKGDWNVFYFRVVSVFILDVLALGSGEISRPSFIQVSVQ